jgi:hypothetical protein
LGPGEAPPGYPLQVRPRAQPTRFGLSVSIPGPRLLEEFSYTKVGLSNILPTAFLSIVN